MTKDVDGILLNPNSTYRASYEYAIKDWTDYAHHMFQIISKRLLRIKNINLDPAYLATLNTFKITRQELELKLKNDGWTNTYYLSKLIWNLLWDKATKIPSQCLNGKCELYTRESENKGTRLRDFVRQDKLKAVMQELNNKNILVKTCNYSIGKHANYYFLNIYYILYLCIKQDDYKYLNWGRQ
jgi:hypothetical protein